MAKLKTYKLTREYLVEAKSQEEAEGIIREAENDLDWLDQEWWEINKPWWNTVKPSKPWPKKTMH
jgi:hypothetical protein